MANSNSNNVSVLLSNCSGQTSFPLPVSFTGIRAYQHNTGVQVEWTTQQESNLAYYKVERSAGGQRFSALGRVAANNAVSASSYSFFDPSPMSGANVYRNRIVGREGHTTSSLVVRVTVSSSLRNSVTIYPNPVTTDLLSLQLNLAKGAYTIRLTNITGQETFNQTVRHPGGSASQRITLSPKLAAGLYQLTLTGEGIRFTQQVLKNQ